MEPIDKKYLKGLTVTGSQPKKTKGEGGDKLTHVPYERDLKPSDVLSWADKGAVVVLVAADGKKHTVSKKGDTGAGGEG